MTYYDPHDDDPRMPPDSWEHPETEVEHLLRWQHHPREPQTWDSPEEPEYWELTDVVPEVDDATHEQIEAWGQEDVR